MDAKAKFVIGIFIEVFEMSHLKYETAPYAVKLHRAYIAMSHV